MSRNEIFGVLVDVIMDILPEIAREDISYDTSLQDIGANSVDRMDIIIGTMETLGIKIPLVKFGEAHCLEDIIKTISEGIE